jgi:hypothetical protein
MTARTKSMLLVPVLCLVGGCHTTAAVDLVTVARRGLAEARAVQQEQHDERMRRLAAQKQALDAAFDADVKLAAAGAITGADGETVALTAEWVIAARKGYAAARDVVTEQMLSAERVHATRMDNLSAADEALEMATDLLLRQAALVEPVRRKLLDIHRRWTHDRQDR